MQPLSARSPTIAFHPAVFRPFSPFPLLTLSSVPPHASSAELLNVAYAEHEIIADYTFGILKWLEGGGAADLSQLAAVSEEGGARSRLDLCGFFGC